MGMRKPRLRMEALVDLSSDELNGIVGGHTIDTTCCTCQTSINSQCGATTCVIIDAPILTALTANVEWKTGSVKG